jgi:hypothetical protein
MVRMGRQGLGVFCSNKNSKVKLNRSLPLAPPVVAGLLLSERTVVRIPRYSFFIGIIRRVFLVSFATTLIPLSVLRGQQHFTDESAERMPNRSDSSIRILLVDVDADGELDILVSNTGFPGALDRLLINDGAGYFEDETMQRLPQLPDQTSSTISGDLDGDGDTDLLACNTSGMNRLLINDGTGVFQDESDTRLPEEQGSRTALIGDMDLDGDLDLVMLGINEAILLLNTGNGFFENGTEGRLPSLNSEARTGIADDLDMDGDLDIVVGFEGIPGIVLSNDGKAVFEEAGTLPASMDTMRTRGMRTCDVDLDGDLDIIDAEFTRGFFGDRVLIVNGSLEFYDMTDSLFPDLPYIRDEGTSPAVTDFDSNGRPDVFISKYEQSLFLVGTASGLYVDGTSERLPPDATTISTWADCGDVDGDGDPDIVISNLLQRNNVYINQSSPDTVVPSVVAVVRPEAHVEPGTRQEVRMMAWDNALRIDSVSISYSVDGGSFDEVPCRYSGGNLYTGYIQGQASGSEVHFYITVTDRVGNYSHDPISAPDSTYSFTVGPGTGIDKGDDYPGTIREPILLQNFPNPFNPFTTISFTLSEKDMDESGLTGVALAVFDMRGRRIQEVFSGELTPGSYEFTWHGADHHGRTIGGGIYFFRLEVSERYYLRKAILLP